MGGALKLTGQWPAPGMTYPSIACCDCLHLRAVFHGFKAPAVAFLLLTMSTSTSCPIPGSRDQLPDGYSTTPGGTLYATTPGGQRAGQGSVLCGTVWGWGGVDLSIAFSDFSSNYSTEGSLFETCFPENPKQWNSALYLAFWQFRGIILLCSMPMLHQNH